jgi:hypothetical protein
MTSNERAKVIEQIIRLVWDSLESHLPYTHTKHHDGYAFHVQCVKEYVEILRLVTKLY